MKKTYVLGNGFLGSRIAKALDLPVITEHIAGYQYVEKILDLYEPKILINCIGYTGEVNTDGCETNKDKTLLANTFVPIMLTEACSRRDIKLIHISTGCMFDDGSLKISEEAYPTFFELFYSRSKIYSDQALVAMSRRYNMLVLRIRIPLDTIPHPKNILTKLLTFRQVIDVPNSVTYIPDFLEVLKFLMGLDAKGVFNVVNKGECRYPQLLEEYKKHQPELKYETYPLDEFSRQYARTNTLLSTDKLESRGFKMRNIEDVYEECVNAYVRATEV